MQDRIEDVEKRYPIGIRVRISKPDSRIFDKTGEVRHIFDEGGIVWLAVWLDYPTDSGQFEVWYQSTDIAPEFG